MLMLALQNAVSGTPLFLVAGNRLGLPLVLLVSVAPKTPKSRSHEADDTLCKENEGHCGLSWKEKLW